MPISYIQIINKIGLSLALIYLHISHLINKEIVYKHLTIKYLFISWPHNLFLKPKIVQ